VAERLGLRVYATDATIAEHLRRRDPLRTPLLTAFASMDLDQRWVNRTPAQMLVTFPWFGGEGFDLLVEDLLRLAPQPVVVEGFRLLPHLVDPLLAARRNAVWLLPTPEFRRAVFDARGGPGWDFLARTGDPEQALRNLLDRDRAFTERLARETRDLGLSAIDVDTATEEEALVDRVAAAFGQGPTA
jgi:hypothetical protein